MGTEPRLRFVTASLSVDYLQPVSIGNPITIRAQSVELIGRKVVVNSTLYSEHAVCARGEVVIVRMPGDWLDPARWI